MTAPDATHASSERACPVCSSRAARYKFTARDEHYGIPGRWAVRECADCASYYLEEPPTAEQLASLYRDDYYSYSIASPSRVKRSLARLLFYTRDTREPAFPAPGRMLDFGCGSGEFLLEMKARGWDCAGVESSPVARARAAELGLDVRASLLGTDGFVPGTFDYVRANHSLEHVSWPEETLRQMRTLLRPGGTLFLGVPTTSSENARVFGAAWWHVTAPLHTFVPSKDGLLRLVERVGFETVKVTTNGDFAGTAGSLQILLNRSSTRRSSQGLVFALKPLLLLGQWYARTQDWRGVGDKLELIATKPMRQHQNGTAR